MLIHMNILEALGNPRTSPKLMASRRLRHVSEMNLTLTTHWQTFN